MVYLSKQKNYQLNYILKSSYKPEFFDSFIEACQEVVPSTKNPSFLSPTCTVDPPSICEYSYKEVNLSKQ